MPVPAAAKSTCVAANSLDMGEESSKEITVQEVYSFDDRDATKVAIVGMAGRFPGANTIDAFWQMKRTGRVPMKPAYEAIEMPHNSPAGFVCPSPMYHNSYCRPAPAGCMPNAYMYQVF